MPDTWPKRVCINVKSGGEGRRKEYAEMKKVSLGKRLRKAQKSNQEASHEVWPEPRNSVAEEGNPPQLMPAARSVSVWIPHRFSIDKLLCARGLLGRFGTRKETQCFLRPLPFVLLRPAALDNFHHRWPPPLTTRRRERAHPRRWRWMPSEGRPPRESRRCSHGRDAPPMVMVTLAGGSSLRTPLLHHMKHSLLFRGHVLLRAREWMLVRRPHAHADLPTRLDRLLPHHGEDDLAVGPYQVVVAFLNMRADNLDVRKGLLDEIFHTLGLGVSQTCA